MSRENVEIVRRIYEADARRDPETALALYDPDVEIDVTRTHGATMGVGIYRGSDHEALRHWFRDWHEAWGDVTYEIHEIVDAGEQVVGEITVRGTGRASQANVEMPRYAGLWTFRNKRVIRVQWFPSRGEALEAVGLSE